MPKLCDAGQPGDEFGRVEQRFVARRHARKLPDDIRLPRQNPSILMFSTRLEPSQKGVSKSLFPKDDSPHCCAKMGEDRKSVVQGKWWSERVDLGGRRIIKQKETDTHSRNVFVKKHI